jgi:hypothetical protein
MIVEICLRDSERLLCPDSVLRNLEESAVDFDLNARHSPKMEYCLKEKDQEEE